MLDPQERHLLLDALRPPDGYELSFAIGTTYTLDLLALLTAPLGFTIFELAGPPGGELAPADAVRLLSVLRRYADRITMFCEAGRIAVPPKHAILFGELERSVVEVRPPSGYSFHPKVWALRFQRDGTPVRYRVLCMTRNLTFDRSWDTLLVLDGVLVDRQRPYARNRPIADFVQALPLMAVHQDVSRTIRESVATAADELRRVEFEVPAPFLDLEFRPLGIEGYRKWPFKKADRTLVAAPFLADGFLDRISGASTTSALISRVDSLDCASRDALSQFDKVFAFNPDVTTEQPQNDEASPDPLGSAGLHAKLYVQEHGWDAHLLTGSANATSAGFGGNVEFLVELTGRRSKCGIDVLLATEKGRVGLRDVLIEYDPSSPRIQLDEALENQRRVVDEVRRGLGSTEWRANIVQTEGDKYGVNLSSGDLPVFPAAFRVSARPVLLPAAAAQPLLGERQLETTFETVTFEGLTSFFVLDLELEGVEQEEPCQFIINAQLNGAPEDRRERITQYLLRDREQVVRFLILLLADQSSGLGETIGLGAPEAGERSRGRVESEALLEPLLRALDRDPAKLDEVATVLEDLQKTPEGRAKLPDGIEPVWNAIWEVRQSMREAAKR